MKIIKCKNYDKLYKKSWEEEQDIDPRYIDPITNKPYPVLPVNNLHSIEDENKLNNLNEESLVTYLDFSVRSRRALIDAGIETISDLLSLDIKSQFDINELKQRLGFSTETIFEIINELNDKWFVPRGIPKIERKRISSKRNPETGKYDALRKAPFNPRFE